MKKLLLVGASGTLGKAIADEFAQDCSILSAGRSTGDFRVDLTDDASVEALFAATGPVDAIVSATGNVHFGPLATMTSTQFATGLADKLLGQVRLALVGQHHLNAAGSITLTTGILSEVVIPQGVNATAVNAGLEGFVLAAACELPPGIRINAVSPSALSESWGGYRDYFKGFEPVPAARAALAYRRSIDGVEGGRVYKVW